MDAIALACLGERDRAKEWLARALAIDPDDNLARYNAACTYSLLGEIDRAIDLLEIYLQQVGSDQNDGSRTTPISTPSVTIRAIKSCSNSPDNRPPGKVWRDRKQARPSQSPAVPYR